MQSQEQSAPEVRLGQEPTTAPTGPAGQGQEPQTPSTVPQSVDANTPVDVAALPANVKNMIEELRKENADHRKAKGAAEVAAKAAEEHRLTQNAEWQKLAEQRKGQIDELQPQAEMATRLVSLVQAQINAEIADWPEQVKNMAPAGEVSVTAMLEWVEKARPLARELLGDKPATPGNGRRPAPVTSAQQSKAASDQQTAWRERAINRYK
jgi:hypothetical protein